MYIHPDKVLNVERVLGRKRPKPSANDLLSNLALQLHTERRRRDIHTRQVKYIQAGRGA